MKYKNLDKLIRIKEKRTFVLNVLCDCGGEFVYDTNDTTSMLASLFGAVSGGDSKVSHKCRKCGKTSKFKHIFPCEKSFEIGLNTSTEDISAYVSQAFEEELEDAIGYSTSTEV